jgi:hypothetical protein
MLLVSENRVYLVLHGPGGVQSPESSVQTPDKHSYHWSKIEGKLLSYIVLKDY